MWRTYGKDENKNDAAGCCLVVDADFFPKSDNYIMLDGEAPSGGTKTGLHAGATSPGYALYNVLYYDRRSGNIIDGVKEAGEVKGYLDDLKTGLEKLAGYNTGQDEKVAGVVSRLVYRFVSEIRYFFKSADYAFERELRVIQFASPSSDKVNIDDNGLPRGLFIESDKGVQPYLRKVILGPKVPNPNRWMYQEVQMRKNGYANFKVYSSTCRYQ
jgi:hypothetical protein